MTTLYYVNSESIEVRDKKGWLDISGDDLWENLKTEDLLTVFSNYDDAVAAARDGESEENTDAFAIFKLEFKGRATKTTFPVGDVDIEALEIPASKAEFISGSLEHVDEHFEEIEFSEEEELEASANEEEEELEASANEEEEELEASANEEEEEELEAEEVKPVVVAPKPNAAIAWGRWALNGTLGGLAWSANSAIVIGSTVLGQAKNIIRPLVRPSVIAGVTTVGGKIISDTLGQTPEMIAKLGTTLTNSTPAFLHTAAQAVDSGVDYIPYVRDVKPLVYLGAGVLAGAEAIHQGVNLYQRRAAAKASATSSEATAAKSTAKSAAKPAPSRRKAAH